MLRHNAIFFLRSSLRSFSVQSNFKRTLTAFRYKCQKYNAVPGVYLYDEINEKCSLQGISKFTERSHTCGELRSSDVGLVVTLCGWLEYRRLGKFAVLRDAYGQTQLLIKDEDTNTRDVLNTIPLESVIGIEGTVLSRPADMINRKQPTGEIEVLIDKCVILNSSSGKLPFNIREFQKAKEELRMKYRYLDLRFAEMQKNMRVRSRMLMDMRDFLINESHFVNVETPTLFKATPGGAQEFVVPTRFPGQFYSLVQSPQQFKQMLMAGGIDRYFQIARCYRDEGSHPDRQPEFTQLDIELSFTNLDGVLELIEQLLQYSWPAFLKPLPLKFKRMTYKYAMENYGTDKPDTRYENKLCDCTDVLKTDKSSHDFGAYYLLFSDSADFLTNKIRTKLQDINKQFNLAKFVQVKLLTEEQWIPLLKKQMGDVSQKFIQMIDTPENSSLFIAYGDRQQCQSLLGKVRCEFAKHLSAEGNPVIRNEINFVWIIDFPLFEKGEGERKLNSAHHPFTAPHPEDLHLLETSPLQVRSLAYDLVLNGSEVGGGSIRIHDAELQEYILKMLDIEKSNLEHMLEMLRSGCPPHGGIALGMDRLFAVILNANSIRDVIAFPKTYEGRDPVSGAPSPISEKDKKLYHIETVDV